MPTSSGVSPVEQDHKNGCHQHLIPWEETQLPSASPGGSLRSVSGPDPSTFQAPASMLGLRIREFLQTFKE